MKTTLSVAALADRSRLRCPRCTKAGALKLDGLQQGSVVQTATAKKKKKKSRKRRSKPRSYQEDLEEEAHGEDDDVLGPDLLSLISSLSAVSPAPIFSAIGAGAERDDRRLAAGRRQILFSAQHDTMS